jgi:amino acid transporter
MLSTRARAIIFVFLLIGGLASLVTWMVAWLGPVSAHGIDVMHAAGDVISVGPDKNFVLETAAGQKITFVCGTSCRASSRHLQRHVKEKAHTDVYYVQGSRNELVVVDAD